MKHLTLLTFLSVQVLAQDVVYLKKNDPAPFAGFLFTPEKEQETRFKLIDAELLKQLDSSNQRIIQYHVQEKEILKQQAELWRNQSNELSKQLVSAEDRSFWRRTLYFMAGALVTTAIVYGVRQAGK